MKKILSLIALVAVMSATMTGVAETYIEIQPMSWCTVFGIFCP